MQVFFKMWPNLIWLDKGKSTKRNKLDTKIFCEIFAFVETLSLHLEFLFQTFISVLKRKKSQSICVLR